MLSTVKGKMAEAPDLATELESAGVPILEDGEEHALQTVDLQTPQSTPSTQPALRFSDTGPPATTVPDDGQRDDQSQIEGTRIEARARTSSKGTLLKEWGAHQIRVTKQLVSEKFGRGTRTVDPNLDERIESLKQTQKKYAQLMNLATQFQTQFGQVVETQKSLAEHFAFMSVRTPELHTEFHYNSDTQKQVARNGETLLAAVQFFVSNMQTVCTKTMEDTLQTVKGYEDSRLTYDAYRNDLEQLKKQANTSEKAAARLPTASAEFEVYKGIFEQLRSDVDIKLKLLDENKVGNLIFFIPLPSCTCPLSFLLPPLSPFFLPPSHPSLYSSVQGNTQTVGATPRGFCRLLLWQPPGSWCFAEGAENQTR